MPQAPVPALSDSDLMIEAMIEYAQQVLQAVGIENGATHMELMVLDKYPSTNPTSPSNAASASNPYTGRIRLVEVGARCHGGDASWLPIGKIF